MHNQKTNKAPVYVSEAKTASFSLNYTPLLLGFTRAKDSKTQERQVHNLIYLKLTVHGQSISESLVIY